MIRRQEAPQPHLPTPTHALAHCASYIAPSTGKIKQKRMYFFRSMHLPIPIIPVGRGCGRGSNPVSICGLVSGLGMDLQRRKQEKPVATVASPGASYEGGAGFCSGRFCVSLKRGASPEFSVQALDGPLQKEIKVHQLFTLGHGVLCPPRFPRLQNCRQERRKHLTPDSAQSRRLSVCFSPKTNT